jgi:hypothetical protein
MLALEIVLGALLAAGVVLGVWAAILALLDKPWFLVAVVSAWVAVVLWVVL